MSTIATSATRAARPATVTAAVVLTVFGIVASLPFNLAPGADDIPAAVIAIGLVFSALTLVGAWGLWRLRRWGAITVAVLTLLNVISAIPGFIEPPSGWILAELIALTPLALASVVLIALPATRRALR
ncbi:MAG TPA: hypothetical protein VFI42_05935 [Thermomicrobiaceae bacterium]|nr:hypothetical protein [Thermomicrobiaceae bacterium]